ncbi:uncharacterized protein LOC131680065 [Topomyia yanbarensis]|uniref:uncharacterized protein LOC131680065 n=1 Tax=Topomyia yanbarensis TaxID=2498891 RepID=UPI00273CBEED|nr:uncharacterized protein LOC131680065 [Topomyia yanbarensis]
MVNNAERVNRVLVTCIRTLLEGDHREWDEQLPAIPAAINSAKHDVTGVSPHCANFGRDLIPGKRGILHTDLYAQQKLDASYDPKVALDMRLSKIQRIQQLIVKRIQNNHEKAKLRYNLRKMAVSFKIGHLVWRKSVGQSSKVDNVNQKLDPKFVPALVKDILEVNLYLLEDITTGKHTMRKTSNPIRENKHSYVHMSACQQ